MNDDVKKEVLKLDNQLCFRLYQVSRNMTRFYQPFLEKFNLTYPQYIVMLVVFEHENIDFKALSDKVDLRTGTLTPMLKKLEEIGYINREVNRDDRRKMTVRITEKGKILNEEILEVPISMYGELEMKQSSYHTMVKELVSLLINLKEGINKKENEK